MYKIALLEADHWHVPGHIKAIAKYENVSIAAVSGQGKLTRSIGEEKGIPVYKDYKELLAKEKDLDFVYVFGIYRESPDIIMACIERNLPFIADKPCCEDSDQLIPVLKKLEEAKLKHCVPLQRRYAQIVEKYKDFIRSEAQKGGVHFVLRYITGTPQRYVNMGFPWAVDKKTARGGTLLNLGVHYIDLVSYLTGDEIVDCHGVINCNVWGLGMDDYASLVLKTKNGHTAVVEVGYTKPGTPEEHFVFTGKNFYITGIADQKMQYFDENGLVEEEDFPDINFFDACLGSMIDHLEDKGQPIGQLQDVYNALKFVKKTYEQNNF